SNTLQLLDSGATNTRWLTITGSNGGNPTINTTAGNVSFGTAIDTGSTGQIVFPATQNPSAGANTLDDYEEGTWTPSLGGNTTYTTQTGTYTKIGRMVHIHMELVISALGTGSATTISGLPFTATATNSGFFPSEFNGLASSVVYLVG